MLKTMQSLRRLSCRVGVAVMMAVAILAPAIAFAQEGPPSPSLRRYPPAWVGFFVMFVLLAVIVTISLMPSKRGHQD